jgi:hypothetical protein
MKVSTSTTRPVSAPRSRTPLIPRRRIGRGVAVDHPHTPPSRHLEDPGVLQRISLTGGIPHGAKRRFVAERVLDDRRQAPFAGGVAAVRDEHLLPPVAVGQGAEDFEPPQEREPCQRHRRRVQRVVVGETKPVFRRIARLARGAVFRHQPLHAVHFEHRLVIAARRLGEADRRRDRVIDARLDPLRETTLDGALLGRQLPLAGNAVAGESRAAVGGGRRGIEQIGRQPDERGLARARLEHRLTRRGRREHHASGAGRRYCRRFPTLKADPRGDQNREPDQGSGPCPVGQAEWNDVERHERLGGDGTAEPGAPGKPLL